MFNSRPPATRQEKIQQVISHLTLTQVQDAISNAKRNYVDLKGRGHSVGVEIAALTVGALLTLGAAIIAYSSYLDDNNDYVTMGEKYRDNKVEERVNAARMISVNEKNQIDTKLFLFNILNGEGENNLQSFKYYLCKQISGLTVETNDQAQNLISDCLSELSNYVEVNVSHSNLNSNESILESERIYQL